ncbi:unnamed protein product, partial [Sphagnum balticum]
DEDLEKERAEYVKSLPNSLIYKDVLILGKEEINGPIFNKFDSQDIFCPRKDDVWIATYPKSGTTWMQAIISLIYHDGNVDQVKGRQLKKLKSLHEADSKRARLISTHLPFQLFPLQVMNAFKSGQNKVGKLIYVVRNPADTAVSYYHFHKMAKHLGNYQKSFSSFHTLFLNGHLAFGDWFAHVKSFWELSLANPESVLFVTFEDLIVDLNGMIRLIAKFVGKEMTDVEIENTVRYCSFDQMKDNQDVNKMNMGQDGSYDLTKSRFMRKGQIGDWINHFSKEDNEKMSKWYEEKMKGISLKL